jgi:hypothetical protein
MPLTPLGQDSSPVDHWRALPRRTLAIALSILPIVALANIGVLVYSLGGINLSEKIVAPGLLWLAALLVFVPMVGNSIRQWLWARFLGLELGFLGSLKVITGTMVTNSVTPSATGGMPIKLLFLISEGIESRRALTLISFQAAEDTLATFGIAALCLGITGFTMFGFIGNDPEILAELDETVRSVSMIALWVLFGLAVLGLVIGGGLLGARVREWFGRAMRKVRGYFSQIAGDWSVALKRGKAIAVVNLALSVLQWAVRFSIAGLVLAAFGVEWQPALFWLLQWLVQTISSIIPTPGGAGGAEAGFLLLFQPFVDKGILFPAMSTWRLMFFYMPLAGSALIFFLLHRRGRAIRRRIAAEGGSSVVPAPAE